jgi:hypothetical protein
VISKRNKISTYKEIHTYPKEGQKNISKRRTKTYPKE